jgi:hypothetical protein
VSYRTTTDQGSGPCRICRTVDVFPVETNPVNGAADLCSVLQEKSLCFAALGKWRVGLERFEIWLVVLLEHCVV